LQLPPSDLSPAAARAAGGNYNGLIFLIWLSTRLRTLALSKSAVSDIPPSGSKRAADFREKINELLELLDMADIRQSYPELISCGERSR